MKYIYYLLSALCISILVPVKSHANLTISENQRNELIKKYAPEVRFHSEEKYFPMAMHNFLSYVDLRDQNKKIMLSPGTVNSTTLANYRTDQYKDYFLGFADKSMKGGVKKENNLVHAPVYVNFVPKEDGAIIQYIFFYPFNGAFQMGDLGPISGLVNAVTKVGDIGEHEGDFEHINVLLDSNYNLVDVYYARHRPSQDGGYDKPELVEGTHPVVYSSKYGHASHPHHRDRQSDQDATSSNGPRWRTWEMPIYVGTKEIPTAGNAWIMFAGHFGGTDGGKESPRGPAHQGWWRTSGYQTFSNLAKVKVENSKSPDFEVKGLPTFIRKLDWNITKVNTAGITADKITYDVTDTSNRVVFPGLKGPRTATRLEKKKFRIGNVRVNGQPNNVSFELEVNSLMD